jgi:hypothetical protein
VRIVPYENALAARDAFARGGADVAVVNFPGAGHEDAILAAFDPVRRWFAGLVVR